MNKLKTICLISGLLALTACSKNASNPSEDTDHAAVTTLLLRFAQGGVQKFEYGFDDPDGPGGNPPTRFDVIRLPKGQTYDVNIVIQNKISGTANDMTEVIRRAGRVHEWFYLPSAGLNLNITKNDKDERGFPLGFNSTWITPTSNQTGTLKITLQHNILKKAENRPTDGHSDINIDFQVVIE